MNNDVVIFGAGAVGLSAAFYLSERGASVTILERAVPGAGSSLKNCGLICPSHFVPLAAPGVITKGLSWMLDPESPFYIKPRLDGALFSWILKFRAASSVRASEASKPVLFDLNNRSANLYSEIAARKLFDFGFQTKGLFLVYDTDHGRAEHAKLAEEGEKFGIPVKEYLRDDVHSLDPGLHLKARGGFLFTTDLHLNPQRYVEGMANFLAGRGVKIVTDAAVESLEIGAAGSGTGNSIKGVVTSKGRFTATEYVLAGGAWSAVIARQAGINLPLQPAKGYSITVPRSERDFSTPMILTERKVAITPLGTHCRFGGTLELAGFDLSINMRRVQAITKAVPLYLDRVTLPSITEKDVWAGLRPCSPDGLPYLGRSRACRNLIVSAGHAMIGISLAPITGKLVSQIAAGQPAETDIAALDPERYN